MPDRTTSLFSFFLVCSFLLGVVLLHYACNTPASIEKPWSKTPCFDKRPTCTNQAQALCRNGVWSCYECEKGETADCYTGSPNTRDVGICKTGKRTCNQRFWSYCKEQVLPLSQEICGNQKDDNCNGQTDEHCECDPKSPPQICGSNIGECTTGIQKCEKDGLVWGKCIGNTKPKDEICDDKDNNCNGKIDENFISTTLQGKGNPCFAGKGECRREGRYICSPDGQTTLCDAVAGQPSKEICDNKDNDCNGKIDEGLHQACQNQCGVGQETCVQGQWVKCNAPQPQTEICDNKDNDCNGKIDELWKPKKGTPCRKQNQSCETKGKWVCKADHSDIFCNAPSPPKPKTEVCDGRDNDCNGKVDDLQAVDTPCSLGNPSGCKKGITKCVQNGKKWNLECVSVSSAPSKEVCDGKDNDCNGKVDDIPEQSCCNDGMKRCERGRWTACQKPCSNTCNMTGIRICKGKHWQRCSVSDASCPKEPTIRRD